MTMPTDSIAFHARLAPHTLAARDLLLGAQWTYAELDVLIGRFAALLQARGCVDGERVAVLARNSVWQVALHFACGRVGAIYVPLNWRLSAGELDALLQRAEPRLFLGDDVAAGRADVVPLIDFIGEANAREPADTAPIPPDRVSLILFTSGTSGQPKGVMLSEQNLQQVAHNFGVTTRVDATSSFLCEAPMFHIIGLVTNVRPVLAVGGSIQVSSGFEPKRTLGWLSDQSLGITHYVGVPQMMQAFRSQPGFDAASLRHLTALVSGGASHASEDLLGWLDDGIPMVCGFGMSEAGTVFGMSVDCAVIRNKLGAVGISTPAVQTRVVDGDGNDCPAGVPGELLLRGPNLSPGYWRDPQASAEALDEHGWFRSGDIVQRDADGFSGSSTPRKTCSFPAARTSIRQKSKPCSPSIRKCANARWWASPTSSGVKSVIWQSCPPMRHRIWNRSAPIWSNAWPSTRCPSTCAWSRRCHAPRPANCRRRV